MSNGDMPAMPVEGGQNNGLEPYSGLTKREHFAAMAMQGILASPTTSEGTTFADIAKISVLAADKLLKELEK